MKITDNDFIKAAFLLVGLSGLYAKNLDKYSIKNKIYCD
jgi:hypothetical protein